MNQKRGTIKLKNRTKGREEEEEVVINGGSTFIFINININIIRRVGHILWLSWSNAKPSFPRSCPIHQKVFNFVFYIFDSLLSLLDSFFYTYIYCFSPPTPTASLYRFHSTRPTLTMMGKRCKTSTCQWKQPLWNTHCGQLLLLKNLTLQWRYSLLCNCNRALNTLFLNTLYVCFSFSFSFSFTQGW